MASTSCLVRAAILFALCSLAGPGARTATLVTSWAAPPGETLCPDYVVRVNDEPVPVYSCRVSAVPFNQVWPGYQRPLDQTELAGFAHWGMSGPVTVQIATQRSFTNVAVTIFLFPPPFRDPLFAREVMRGADRALRSAASLERGRSHFGAGPAGNQRG